VVPPVATQPASPVAAEPAPPWRSRRRLSRNQRLRRQWEGEELDLDAAIDVQVERRLALAPDGRLFVRPGSEAPRCSVLVLLDLSASTGDVAAGSTQSLLAVEQQAALLLARAAQVGLDRIAIHGFASNTRAAVHYLRLLDFGTPLNAGHTQRILHTRAAGSTRIGAALRHATRCLLAEPAGPRAIVLVTDGAPSDVDVFDVRYLTEDARAAVLAARRLGVQCHGSVVDAGSDAYVRRIFGWCNYRVVARTAQLPRALQELHEQLSA
jgi:nitric oxide reductase NorD protein